MEERVGCGGNEKKGKGGWLEGMSDFILYTDVK